MHINRIVNGGSAISAIEKGQRSKWWKRIGGKSRGFRYLESNGNPITNQENLDRIASLVIPPAWKHVRIAPFAGAKIQAVGIDTSGRIQYIYSPKFAKKQQEKKFAKLLSFGMHLPQLRETSNADISLEGLPKQKVLAVVLRLINTLYFRVGSEMSVRKFRTYGITTLKNDHLSIARNGSLKFDFVGKSYVRHRKIFVDKEMADTMRELKSIGPKKKLFCYIDEGGNVRPIKPADINSYIKEAADSSFSSKDFRTWGATLMAATRLAEIGPSEIESEIKKNIVRAVKRVAEELGNTPTVCRASYIHPVVIELYEKGITIKDFTPRKSRRIKRIQSNYEAEEIALLRLLEANGK